MAKPRIRSGEVGRRVPNKIDKRDGEYLIRGRKTENLFNKSHLVPSQAYKEGWERIFGNGRCDAEESNMD